MNVTPDLDARFREAALREGLVDVRYDIVDSPVGELFVAATDRGLARISYWPDGMEETLARTFGVACCARRSTTCAASSTSTSRASAARSTCRSTCASRRSTPTCSASSRSCRTGAPTRTARSRRRSAGRARARAVGTVMNRNPIPIVLPCHRIVGANGSLTGYAGGLDVKLRLLQLEGAMLV